MMSMQRKWLLWFGVGKVLDRSAKTRSDRDRRLKIELLESRQLLSASPLGFATPNYRSISTLAGIAPLNTAGPTGYSPQQVRHAYGFDQVTFSNGAVGDGSGTTIAIVDAYDDPNIASDLQKFDAAFGLPNPVFTKVNQTGGSTMPAANKSWATEIALDVEWAHAIAPGAKILLVEAKSNSMSDLMAAVDYARHASGVVAVSMSWSGGEFSTEVNYDSYFTTPAGHAGVSFFVSSGDTGAPTGYPDSSPNVVAVGGTSLSLSGSNYSSESGWSGSGGGITTYEAQPSYQTGVVTQSTTRRASPDVSYDSDPNTGFPVYDSYNNGTAKPWGQWGGTSDAAPQWAALVAIADQGRAIGGLGSLDSRTQLLPALYKLPASDFHDITSGTSTGSPHYTAAPGYDLVTGRGTPIANLVIKDLSGQSTATSTTHFSVAASISTVAGAPFSITVSALDASNNAVATYQGTVHLTSTDLGIGVVLPTNYTFTAADKGIHTFTGVTLVTPGAQSVSVKDTVTSTIAGSASVNVTASATHFSIAALTSTVAGAPFSITVSALDGSNNVFNTYLGSVHFTSTDLGSSVVLPTDYTFTAADQGVHTFTAVALVTAGAQTVTAKDKATSTISGAAGVNVTPATAAQLAFGQQPANVVTGKSISPVVTVKLLDAYNNLVTTDNTDQVTLAIGNNPSSGALSGTTTITATGGVATFGNVSVNNIGAGYTLVASSPSWSSVASAAFNVVSQQTTGTIEGFDTGNLSAYKVLGGTTPSASAVTSAAHDGTFGLSDSNGADWIYRTDAAAKVKAGDTISVWLRFTGTADGRAYFGFGSSTTGTLALVAAPNTNQWMLMKVDFTTNSSSGGTFTQIAAVTQTWQPNQWYRLQVNWGSSGLIVGKLFASDGVTLLSSVQGVQASGSPAITSGGIAFRGFGSHVKSWDTVQLTPGVNSFASSAVASTMLPKAANSGWGVASANDWTGSLTSFASPPTTNSQFVAACLSVGTPATNKVTTGTASKSPLSTNAIDALFASDSWVRRL
jgi:hypothetical protein